MPASSLTVRRGDRLDQPRGLGRDESRFHQALGSFRLTIGHVDHAGFEDDVEIWMATLGSSSLRTYARPAIEYVSGEEGLRPLSHCFVLSFVEYAFMDALKYGMDRGDGGTALLTASAPSVSQCVVSLRPVA